MRISILNSSIEWCGASYPIEKGKENSYKGKSEPIPDLFDYYHGEEVNKKNIFSIGEIEPGQYNQLQELLEQHTSLFA
ncbi:38528_t:CDS:2 [Gigaspora margarita]|uniref:38528_t:CDS:1 n=1 Tax=Gigaspora margarita TaxID=4874 RepID=A0ABM8W2B3_GIGMA|nr:38528_t:CDS:2 [Gigaspora margarita]